MLPALPPTSSPQRPAQFARTRSPCRSDKQSRHHLSSKLPCSPTSVILVACAAWLSSSFFAEALKEFCNVVISLDAEKVQQQQHLSEKTPDALLCGLGGLCRLTFFCFLLRGRQGIPQGRDLLTRIATTSHKQSGSRPCQQSHLGCFGCLRSLSLFRRLHGSAQRILQGCDLLVWTKLQTARHGGEELSAMCFLLDLVVFCCH